MVWVSRKAESRAPCRADTGRRRRQRQRCHPLKLRRVRLRNQIPDVYSPDEHAASLLAAQQGDLLTDFACRASAPGCGLSAMISGLFECHQQPCKTA